MCKRARSCTGSAVGSNSCDVTSSAVVSYRRVMTSIVILAGILGTQMYSDSSARKCTNIEYRNIGTRLSCLSWDIWSSYWTVRTAFRVLSLRQVDTDNRRFVECCFCLIIILMSETADVDSSASVARRRLCHTCVAPLVVAETAVQVCKHSIGVHFAQNDTTKMEGVSLY